MNANPIEAQQICSSCEQAIRHGLGDLKHVPGLIKRIIREELWRVRKVETHEIVELTSFRELIVGKFPRGWDADADKVYALIETDPDAVTLWRQAMKEQGRRNDIHDNVMEVTPKQGNTRAYTLERLSKQRPDLYARVKAGELSANAAAISAGWRAKKTPLEQLLNWWKKASIPEREKFLKEIAL